jgi:Reverse transcriptase (RNA-dependent DNA polymerase)
MDSCLLPANQKRAIVRPILKKPSLDASEPNSYRPISNLSFLSKLIERCVAARYVDHAERQYLFPARQSAYRKHHSTETTVVSVLNDVISAADQGKITALVLLDLSSAFDCVNHDIMIQVLNERFHVDDQALAWFHSYFADRSQIFRVDGRDSVPCPVTSSVPQLKNMH